MEIQNRSVTNIHICSKYVSGTANRRQMLDVHELSKFFEKKKD